MQPFLRGALLTGLASVLISAGVDVIAGDYSIAGTSPHERPVGAPVVDRVSKGDAWYQNALKGVSKPYPESLGVLEDQGNWYTPFIYPGMTGRYDIRGWHAGHQ